MNANVADGQCTSDTHVCKTIFDANNAVHDGDTIDIKGNDKPYVEQPIVVKRKNVTFEALPGTGTVTITGPALQSGATNLDNNDVFVLGDATGDTTNGHGDGTILRGLTITSQPQGGRAVFVRAANTTVDNCTLIRQELTDTDVPVYDVEDTLISIDDEGNHVADGPLLGTQTVKNSVIIQKPRADTGLEAPALFGGDSSSLLLVDDFIVTGQTDGPAVVYTGNDVTGDADKGTEQAVPNLLVRSYVLTGGDSSNAIEIKSNWDSDTPKALDIDSSIISAGPHGIGLKAESVPYPSGGPGLGPLGLFPRVSRSGDITIVMDESTIAGSDQGVVLGALADASVSVLSGPSSPHGNVYMDADRSIVHGSNTVINNPGDASPLATRAPNEADLRFLDSDVWDTEDYDSGSGATMEVQDQGNTNTPDAQLFINPAARDYHLRPDAPVIDKAGKPKIGESDKDYEGDARVWGAAADRGGDEFVDRAPSALFSLSKTTVREGEVVTLDGTASRAYEDGYGNQVIGWAWDFGDGTKQITTTPTVTHKYAKRGSYTATLVAIDKFKMLSSPATQAVAVQDGIAPSITILQPKSGQKIAVQLVGGKTAKGKTTAKKPAAAPKAVKSALRVKLIRVAGTAKDDSGVAAVQIAIRRISAGRPARTAAVKRTKQCTFFDPTKRKFMKKPCRKPTWFNVHLLGANWDWAYRVKHGQFLRTGTYEIQARGIDKFGNVSTPVLRRFRVG